MRACVDLKREGADPWTFEAFLWLPTDDHEPPSPLHLQMGMSFLRQCEEAAIPVFVHCLMGVGRSASLVLAHLLVGSVPRGGASTRPWPFSSRDGPPPRRTAPRSRPRWKRPATSPGRKP